MLILFAEKKPVVKYYVILFSPCPPRPSLASWSLLEVSCPPPLIAPVTALWDPLTTSMMGPTLRQRVLCLAWSVETTNLMLDECYETH